MAVRIWHDVFLTDGSSSLFFVLATPSSASQKGRLQENHKKDKPMKVSKETIRQFAYSSMRVRRTERAFKAHFGFESAVVAQAWNKLERRGLKPEKAQPFHLLWFLDFCKEYLNRDSCTTAVDCDGDTFKEWAQRMGIALSELDTVSIILLGVTMLSVKRKRTDTHCGLLDGLFHDSPLKLSACARAAFVQRTSDPLVQPLDSPGATPYTSYPYEC